MMYGMMHAVVLDWSCGLRVPYRNDRWGHLLTGHELGPEAGQAGVRRKCSMIQRWAGR